MGYKFYKGEDKSPYNPGSVEDFFWFYESKFAEDWENRDAADWYSFFKDQGYGKQFLEIVKDLEDTDASIEGTKDPIFELWKKYLFSKKLSPNDKLLYDRA